MLPFTGLLVTLEPTKCLSMSTLGTSLSAALLCVPRCAASFQPRGPRTSGLYNEPAWQISLRARRVKNGQAAGKMPCN